MPAGADGIDDWFVPGQSPGRIAPWTPQTDHLFPDDWISPDNWNAPRPPTAPRTALPPPSPQPNATNPAISNRPARPPDPFAAYWALIPASPTGTRPWQPPFFPSSNPPSLQNIPASPWVTPPPLFPNLLRQFPWTTPAPTNIPSDTAPNACSAASQKCWRGKGRPPLRTACSAAYRKCWPRKRATPPRTACSVA